MEACLSCGGRAALPDGKRCQSSCALEVALEAAAPDVRMAAIAQEKRYLGTSFIIRSLLQAGLVLFFVPVFPVGSMSVLRL